MPVGGGRSGDEQHLVLLGQRGDLQRHSGGGRAGQDLVALTDQVGGLGHRLGRVSGVVPLGHLDRAAVHLAGAVGGVVQPGLEAGDVLLAVGLQRPGVRVHQADLHRGGVTVIARAVVIGGLRAAAAGGHQARRDQRDHPRPERVVTLLRIPFLPARETPSDDGVPGTVESGGASRPQPKSPQTPLW